MKRIRRILKSTSVLLGLLLCQQANGQSPDQNYIMTRMPLVEISDQATLNAQSSDRSKVVTVIGYYDGLNRRQQTVIRQGSPSGNDLIKPYAYDEYGREAKEYLPYTAGGTSGTFRSDALPEGAAYPTGGQYQFYQQGSEERATTSYPYSEKVFERSPLQRVREQGAPDGPWQPQSANVSGGGHSLKISYQTNAGTEVRLWTAGASGASGGGYYPEGSLSKTVFTDENGNRRMEFRDNLGQVVLKQSEQSGGTLDTYYIYDEQNNLRYIIPPLPSEVSFPPAFTEADAVFRNFIYGYRYDGRRRMIEKKHPGRDPEYYVYNRLNQLVLQQDGNQRSSGKWLFSKYDALGRMILQGILSSSSSRADWENTVNAMSVLWETRDAANANGTGYSGTQTVPYHSQVQQYYSIQYYDDYSFRPTGSTYASSATGISSRTRGLSTGSRTNVLGSTTMQLSVQYYDEEGRVREVISDHHKGGTDRVVNTYNFSGEVTAMVRSHSSTAGSVKTETGYTYDHLGRQRLVKEKITGSDGATSSPVVLARYDYNELGQLYKKHLHSADYNNTGIPEAGTFQYGVTYSYHARGWLKGISSPLFSTSLTYESGNRYNGDITSASWGATSSADSYTFHYSYDQQNRLLSGVSQDMSESGITYDQTGNIRSLTRDGQTISYNYVYTGEQGNRLSWVSGPQWSGVNYFGYDANGNITRDDSRGISGVEYNSLNLPQTVISATGTLLSYQYDAAGNKLRNINNRSGRTTDYIGGIHYENNSLSTILTEEGTARRSGNTYTYEYWIQDHLGNTRLSFYRNPGTGQTEVLQREDYYPYGLNRQRSTSSGKTNYLYNGKELQEGFDLLDYGARFYDPVLGRFNHPDAFSDSFESQSPYSYAFNNPLNGIDPSGNYALKLNGADIPAGFQGDVLNMLGLGNGGMVYETVNQVMNDVTISGYMGYDPGKELDEEEILRGGTGELTISSRQVQVQGGRGVNLAVNKGDEWLDGAQLALDGLGMTEIPIISQGAELISAGISLSKGDYTGAAIGLGSMIPVGGKAFEAMKVARRIQKHHIIPNAVYKTFKKELKAMGWAQNAGLNLKKLPTPFHGNHPAYNKYISEKIIELKKVGNLNLQSMERLQYDLRQQINSIYLNGPGTLNNFYK